MAHPERRLILANGEEYVKQAKKELGFGPPLLPRSYDEARGRVIGQIQKSLERIKELPPQKKIGDEVVLALRLHPDATAKTYNPEALFRTVRDLENVGSRNYAVAMKEVAQTDRIKKQVATGSTETTGRMLFVRSNQSGFRQLITVLDKAQAQLPKAFQEDIRRIEWFDLLGANEQLQAFRADRSWERGRVELVFHPTRYGRDAQIDFFRQLFKGTEAAKGRATPYEDGPTFVSCVMTRADLDRLGNVNPLRTAHPLSFEGVDDLRTAPAYPAPPPPTAATRSTIKVGIFDGGIDPKHPYLNGHAEEDVGLSVKKPAEPLGVAHGTAVAGAVLYGALNDHNEKQPLPPPPVSVVSVRVFPLSNPKDPDLHEAIDLIEAAVPARPDVLFWNISFGPKGPILDDTISRFTYALDSLAVSHRVGFCAAVGNHGTRSGIWARIQAPSDLVNGLGVGAFTQRKGAIMRAPYSCKGPGRECGKLKPDLVAFGGCDHTPMHLLSSIASQKLGSSGTSFSSPLVTAIGAQAVGAIERGTALAARTLLVHTAKHPDDKPDAELGHGLVRSSLDDLVRCDQREVTVLFQKDIAASSYVRLPLMLPPNLVGDGKIQITWTVGALPKVNSNHPSDYTTMCIEDTFYPNSLVYPFKNPDPKGLPKCRTLHLKDDAAEIEALLTKKWVQADYPQSGSGNVYTEQDRRLDLKWEPIVRRTVRKLASSLHEPFLLLHAIARHGAQGRMDYAAVVTISTTKFDGDLYGAVLKARPALQPVRLREESEIRIKI